MENFQKKLDEVISRQITRRQLALHSCCGPCSSYVLEYLMQYFDITLFFYNPNIYPQQEYEHRYREQLRLCEMMGVTTFFCEYEPDHYFEYVKGLEAEPEGGLRCAKCFEMRLDFTAAAAKRAGIDLFLSLIHI